MARITLDLDALLAEGRITQAEAERLNGLAAPSKALSTLIQVLYVLGALALGVAAFARDRHMQVARAAGA